MHIQSLILDYYFIFGVVEYKIQTTSTPALFIESISVMCL
jgi:hypothetical protein